MNAEEEVSALRGLFTLNVLVSPQGYVYDIEALEWSADDGEWSAIIKYGCDSYKHDEVTARLLPRLAELGWTVFYESRQESKGGALHVTWGRLLPAEAAASA